MNTGAYRDYYLGRHFSQSRGPIRAMWWNCRKGGWLRNWRRCSKALTPWLGSVVVSSFRELMVENVLDHFCIRFDLQILHNPGTVRVDCAWTEKKLLGNYSRRF